MSLKSSIALKPQSRESLFIEKLNEPMSPASIKLFSNPTPPSTLKNSKTIKVKKLTSLDSSSTNEDLLAEQEAKFVYSYRNDVIFRKKIDILLKQNEKRVRQIQENQIVDFNTTIQSNFTWRALKHSQDMRLLQIQEKCRKWMSKVNQDK